MKLDLSGKVAVVSGSTSGIGLGIARGLAKTGATVVIVGKNDRNADSGSPFVRLMHRLREFG
ncbi:SDR family NAD(P)-dependent oxidoreductase [Enterobacteriaceae bacterium 8376wG6]|nr:SDR family NAD(P)-dependent oxidoreductase [Enterobacteriaceae bacterium 8376wG6]